MLKIEFDQNFDNQLIQQKWEKGLIPHFVGIVIGNGNMIAMTEKYIDNKNFSVSPEYDSSIEDFISIPGQYIDVTVMVSRAYIAEIDCYAICGEGEMGNEGFVAIIKEDILIWSAFFTISNPFYEVKIIDNMIIAKSTHDIRWAFPIYEPWKVSVLF